MSEQIFIQVCPVCCTDREGRAEELPFADGSVDLLTAATAAHWFEPSRFLAEASRVLKPRGCIALLYDGFSSSRFYYQDCGDRLNHIYTEVGYTFTLTFIKKTNKLESKICTNVAL